MGGHLGMYKYILVYILHVIYTDEHTNSSFCTCMHVNLDAITLLCSIQDSFALLPLPPCSMYPFDQYWFGLDIDAYAKVNGLTNTSIKYDVAVPVFFTFLKSTPQFM